MTTTMIHKGCSGAARCHPILTFSSGDAQKMQSAAERKEEVEESKKHFVSGCGILLLTEKSGCLRVVQCV